MYIAEVLGINNLQTVRIIKEHSRNPSSAQFSPHQQPAQHEEDDDPGGGDTETIPDTV